MKSGGHSGTAVTTTIQTPVTLSSVSYPASAANSRS